MTGYLIIENIERGIGHLYNNRILDIAQRRKLINFIKEDRNEPFDYEFVDIYTHHYGGYLYIKEKDIIFVGENGQLPLLF